jgi:hypothetical protein
MRRYKAFYFDQVKGNADKTKFFERSLANFTPCSIPDRAPDYVSKSGSAYWYTTEGVIRGADHWGGVASCRWTLGGNELKTETPVGGFCRWNEIALSVAIEVFVEIPPRKKIKAIMDWNGRKVMLLEKVA